MTLPYTDWHDIGDNPWWQRVLRRIRTWFSR